MATISTRLQAVSSHHKITRDAIKKFIIPFQDNITRARAKKIKRKDQKQLTICEDFFYLVNGRRYQIPRTYQ